MVWISRTRWVRMMVTNIDWDSVPLGLEPDHIIAKRLGCRPFRVSDNRRKRGIPSPEKEAQRFQLGAVATYEQQWRYKEQWEQFPLTTEALCRQCEEDFYLDKQQGIHRLRVIARRDTDHGVYCLKHYAALPLCVCCEREFAPREGGLCESCCNELGRQMARTYLELEE
jgi:hypothetical protein